jgi:mono/diheme cytochrome c family protein
MMTKREAPQPTNPLIFILPFSLLGIVIAVMIIVGSAPRSPTNILSQEQLTEGKRLYDLKCASCHGAQGEGQYPDAPNQPDVNGLIGAPPHDSTGHTWHHADSFLINHTKNGSSILGFHPMPAFGNELSDDQIRAILAYIKTWWKLEHLAAQATKSASQ